MKRLGLLAFLIVAVGAPLSGCASDEPSPDVETPEEDVPFDPSVGDGVDTEVEKSENLNIDGDEG